MTDDDLGRIEQKRETGMGCDQDGVDLIAEVRKRGPRSPPAYPGAGHPWADFLHHRARAMRMMRDEENRSPVVIASILSMDPWQVASILANVDAHPEEYSS